MEHQYPDVLNILPSSSWLLFAWVNIYYHYNLYNPLAPLAPSHHRNPQKPLVLHLRTLSFLTSPHINLPHKLFLMRNLSGMSKRTILAPRSPFLNSLLAQCAACPLSFPSDPPSDMHHFTGWQLEVSGTGQHALPMMGVVTRSAPPLTTPQEI